MKKTIHVISHSHWDREWYLPLEEHNMRLVDLIDGVIRASKDPKFKSFQMDGQLLPIEDYLKVREDKREEVYRLIKERKIIVGPWYILQDAFLASAESNVRNLELGLRLADKIGDPAMVGYFPDTFGIMGQASQILKKAGIEVAYFARGVKATGFSNVVIDDYSSKNSELIWKSPDGSEVLGILFANWYCNGVDMPEDRNELKTYLDKRISDMEKYASTNQLLLMNGCDHAPVQENIGSIIEIANSLYDDYEFIHSDLDMYYEAVKKDIDKNKVKTIKGELRSQENDGWGTLTSTSSSRYDLKRLKDMVEMRIEKISQPLYSLFMDEYPVERFDYLYKKLLSNLTHDAICGCSIDSVHEGNIKRFKDCLDILDYLDKKAKEKIKNKIELDSDTHFFLINTLPYEVYKDASVIIDYKKEYIDSENIDYLYDKLNDIKIKDQVVFDKYQSYETKITDLGANFDYELPENSFRKPYFARKIRVDFRVKLKAFEKREFGLKSEKTKKDLERFENKYLEIKINDDGSLDIKDKRVQRTYKNVLKIEDSGDIGNEYIYVNAKGKSRVFESKLVKKEVENHNDRLNILLKEEMIVPKSAEKRLDEEQKKLVFIKDRKSKRSDESIRQTITKEITVYKDEPDLDIKISIDNKAKDHRMRILFGHDNLSDTIDADSIFENVKRRAYPPKTWTNPDYSQNFNEYLKVSDKNAGFIVSSLGCHEYENIKDEGLFISLFRSTREMGDWGYFPTEDSQMLKKMEFDFHLSFFIDEKSYARQKVLARKVPYFSYQAYKSDGKDNRSTLNFDIKDNLFSTIYTNERGQKVLRIFNPDNYKKDIGDIPGKIVDILAKNQLEGFSDLYLKAYEIRTIVLED